MANSRTIKFRSWNGKRMISVGEIKFPRVKHQFLLVTSHRYKKENSLVNPPIMQFTGLKDKNGKEIYEDDVIKDKNGNLANVKWNVSSAGFYFNAKEWTMGKEVNAREVEVVGNIYENAELLNK